VDPRSIDPYRTLVDDVIRRGRAARALLAERADGSAAAAVRVWQKDCEAAVAQLSGGRKTHWLSRAYNDALLVRSDEGRVVDHVDLSVIVDRLLGVLERAREALERLPAGDAGAPSDAAAVHRFDFVHDEELRPVLEQALVDSRQALDGGRFDEALMASCGILEAIITDALLHRNPAARDEIVSHTFAERIAAAEGAGLIRNGCARLPPVARAYREIANDAGGTAAPVREGDARITGQVLRVIMRDLDPGR
jgi:hypothetical protein